MIELVGFAAGIFIAIASLPQIIKSWKAKSTSDLSYGLIILNCIGQILYIIYGIMLNSYALTIMSSLTLTTTFSLLILKYKYK